MIKKCSLIICLLLITAFGLYLRIDNFKHKHPDQDELFELQKISNLDLGRVLSRTEFYGDHTSFPGEFLLNYIPVSLVLGEDVAINVGEMKVTGLSLDDFWRLAYVKIAITVLGFICLIFLFKDSWYGIVGLLMYSVNPHLVYHAFAIRPYSVLPELAIFNFMLCGLCFNRRWAWLPYSLLFFFTCIYHAYGILIALLPLAYYCLKHKKVPWLFSWVVLVSVGCWAYYASYNSFGMTPNAVQTQVSAFEYMPLDGFSLRLFTALTGGGLLMYCIAPVLMVRAFKMNWLFVLVLVILPLLLVMGVSIKTSAWILPRYFIWVMPWFIIYVVMELKSFCEENLFGN